MIASIITKSQQYFVGSKMPLFVKATIIFCTVKKNCYQLNYDALIITTASWFQRSRCWIMNIEKKCCSLIGKLQIWRYYGTGYFNSLNFLRWTGQKNYYFLTLCNTQCTKSFPSLVKWGKVITRIYLYI